MLHLKHHYTAVKMTRWLGPCSEWLKHYWTCEPAGQQAQCLRMSKTLTQWELDAATTTTTTSIFSIPSHQHHQHPSVLWWLQPQPLTVGSVLVCCRLHSSQRNAETMATGHVIISSSHQSILNKCCLFMKKPWPTWPLSPCQHMLPRRVPHHCNCFIRHINDKTERLLWFVQV